MVLLTMQIGQVSIVDEVLMGPLHVLESNAAGNLRGRSLLRLALLLARDRYRCGMHE